MPSKETRNDNLQKANMESHKIVEESLKEALFALLKIKDIKDITITELVKKAGVSRSVFYKHYYLVTDVLKKEVYNTSSLVRKRLSEGTLYEKWLKILTVTYEKRERLLLVIKADMALDILRCFNDILYKQDEVERSLAWNGIIFNEILYWAKKGFKEAPEELATKLTKITQPFFLGIEKQLKM